MDEIQLSEIKVFFMVNRASSSSSQAYVVLALYKFVPLDDFRVLRPILLELCRDAGICGTLLLAAEGINGTVAGSRAGIDRLLAWLHADGRFEGMEAKESLTEEAPFFRMKVKLKKEIVTMGVPGIAPQERTGTRVAARDWNALISDPDVVLLDTRNPYEYDIGTFKDAVVPEIDTFREFPDFVDRELDPTRNKRVAMFCTGGIRCEKASAYLLDKGFEAVYQLDGGILRYFEEVEAEESLWQGECFVFDGRVAVNHDLSPGVFVQCHACRMPLSPEERASDRYEEGVSCPHCFDRTSDAKKAGLRERQRQMQIAAARHQRHIGAVQASSKPAREGANPEPVQEVMMQGAAAQQ